MRRLAGAALVALLATACGSTVQVRSTTTAPGAVDDGTTGVVLPGSGTPGSTSGALTGGTPGGSGSGTTGGAPSGRGAASGGTGTTGSVTGAAPGAPTAKPVSAGKQVEVGVFVFKDLGAATKALGYDGLSTGDGTNQGRAAVDLLNRRGGLAGHPVKPVIYTYDATSAQAPQFQAACSSFFDDHKVVAVVSALLIPVIQACAGKRGVPFVTSGNRTTAASEFAKHPLLVSGSQLSLDRAVPQLVASLVQQGWLTKSSRTGLLYNEDADYAGVPGLVADALKAAGMPALVDKQSMPGVDDTSRVTAASSAGQNAALRFSTQRIDRVIVVDKSGQAIGYFAIGAQNNNYYPAYGVSSLSLPNALRTVLSARQLENARGIGWSPGVDVNVPDQRVTNANQRDCLSAMKSAGENTSAAVSRFSALSICDGVLLLGAAWRDPALTTASFTSGLRALGPRYPAVMTLSTDFTSHRDGAAAYRPIAFTQACDCWKYTGPDRSA